jgi:hypothetical protein
MVKRLERGKFAEPRLAREIIDVARTIAQAEQRLSIGLECVELTLGRFTQRRGEEAIVRDTLAIERHLVDALHAFHQ